VSFVVGYAAIAWLLKFVSHHTLVPFVVYRVLLGGAVIGLLAAGVLSV
jgi:undecaprenyl-diphosphatase